MDGQAKIEVGTILHGSWGYDQTNCEFYKVVRATEKSAWMVNLGGKHGTPYVVDASNFIGAA